MTKSIPPLCPEGVEWRILDQLGWSRRQQHIGQQWMLAELGPISAPQDVELNLAHLPIAILHRSLHRRKLSAVMTDTPEDKEYLDALVLLYSGMKCFDRGDHDDAIERYSIALKILDKWAGGSPHLRPDDKRKGDAKLSDAVLSLRGDAYKATGDHERALADYNASIALNAENVRSYMARADLHEKMGDRNSAIADFQKALDLNPDMLPQYVNECKNALKRLGTMH